MNLLYVDVDQMASTAVTTLSQMNLSIQVSLLFHYFSLIFL